MSRRYDTSQRIIYASPGTTINITATPIRRGPTIENRRQRRKAAAMAKLAAAAAENAVKQTTQAANPHSEAVKPSSKVVDSATKSPEPIMQPAAKEISDEVEKNVG
ncbi:hypothetical protein BOTNAR_0405g00030 [Botryotinia narcissicola]|uniref:Uncharacterized protein n=1 Tax=Botryotinia narcissicola TaxID=278944 RepID=A0A4Z1HZ96_9HELO|nr:hypothetical protein BOTNAR_0405g00030 [Botryotinia narcissicola]